MSPVKEPWDTDGTFTILLLECQVVAFLAFTFVYLCCPALTSKDKGGPVRETDHTRERGGGRQWEGRESEIGKSKPLCLGSLLDSVPCMFVTH